MSSEHLQKAGELFHAALEQEPEQRGIFLKQACGNDEALRLEVESLLAAHQHAQGFMQAPAFQNVESLEPEDQLSAGQQIGAYKIAQEIGRGGMGAVYLAERADEQYKKFVAIKLVKRGMDTDYILGHFKKERQILANFDHSNIARLLDGGSTETGLPYFVMEYVEGKPIDSFCDQQNLNITQRLQLFQQVCSAVSYAHRNLVVHRDIKPSNILVTNDGVPKLLDFGIAKILQTDDIGMTATAVRLMTPEFASPEQAQGLPVTTSSDVYSLGVVLYELLTGHLPYQLKSRTPFEIARTISETHPQLPSSMITNTSADGVKVRESSPDRLQKRLRGDLDNIVLMALRKEPQRRYQSVEQFSEDIRRHLEGLPVIARQDTFGYHFTKFVQRNKVPVSIGLVAFLAIALFAGIAGFVQWKANQQATFLQEFGQEAARMEGIMRYAYLLPLHNIDQEKRQVVERLQQLKMRMENLGTQANGPGHYALGRGFLALHRYQDAYDHLLQSWQKNEYQKSHVAYALGLSLAMLYQEKLQEAEETSSKEQLRFTKAKLEKDYRDPGLLYIRQGASTSEAPEYVEAMLALLASDYSQALEKSNVAEKKITWLYEAKKLQGDIYKAMGSDRMDSGEFQAALDLYEKARAAYLEAAVKGQSDPQIYEGLCTLQQRILRMKMQQSGLVPEKDYTEGLSYCNSALRIDPRYVSAFLTTAHLHIGWGYYQRTHGESLQETIQKAVQNSQKALEIEPENSSAHLVLGNAYGSLADEEIDKEGNPTPYLDLADKSFAIVVSKSPENPRSHYIQGRNFLERAFYEIDIGKDPSHSFQNAIPSLKRAVDGNPKDTTFLVVLGNAYRTKASYEISTGMNATESLKSAIECFAKATQMNPNFKDAYGGLAETHISMADLKSDLDQDPTQELDESIKALNKILEIDPSQPYAFAELGQAYWKKAQYQYKKGTDPSLSLDSARNGFTKCVSLNKNLVECYARHANVEQIAAKFAIAQKKEPWIFFKKSQELINQGLVINSETPETLESLAALCLVRSEYGHLKGKALEEEINNGIRAADRAIAINSQIASTHAVRGQLQLMLARFSPTDQRLNAAQEALASFHTATKIKPSLSNTYRAKLEEAQKIVAMQ